VFLQDLCGCISSENWLSAALRFLEGYGRGEARSAALSRLLDRLRVPSGIPLVWWVIRANYVSPAKLRRQFGALRKRLESV